MHLKSLTLKGFKSFPDRTKLDFGPGVSVVVGPNGSGKSNVTDALLWAMGEQSPLAVRGQSMQDVIFGGGRGVQARSAAEVEIVLDNSDETVDLPLSEISIVRRLDRSGDGEYRLNGARARLVDVIEVLSDTGLGKETHSVISQGRVEAIVTSKPRDRRLLIEEAAGLGKHRKRRRRAQLKLERTQENLDRALDVEREARTRLRPLKRQAEAAELHERLEHQMLQARFELAREAVRVRRVQLVEAEEGVQAARAAREQIESRLRAVVERRGRAESALAERTERHDALSRRVYEARSARERLQMRGEQAAATAATLAQRASRIEIELGALEQGSGTRGDERGEQAEERASVDRVCALEAALAEIDRERERELERELEGLEREREQAGARVTELEGQAQAAREARGQADALAELARVGLRKLEGDAEAARRGAAKVGAELAAANQFLRSHAGAHGAKAGAPRALSDALQVKPGYELALAAALGGRLDAALVRDMDGARTLLDGVGPDGGAALLAGEAAGESDGSAEQDTQAGQDGEGQAVAQGSHRRSTEPAGKAPAAGALRLIDLLSGSGPVLALAHRLLADAWVVERLEDVAEDFRGVASTASGRVLFAGWGELRQVTEGGAERVLARRNERDRLVAESERAVVSEHAARAAVEQALEQAREANLARDKSDGTLRDSERLLGEAAEAQRKAIWLIEQRKAAPEQGPLAVRRAELQGELAAERRQAERRQAERAERARRIERLRAQRAADIELTPRAERLATVLAGTSEAMAGLLTQIEALLSEDRAAGEQVSAELRACAQEEAEIQAALRVEGEAVTGAEVAAQRLRDQTAEAQEELREVSQRLELPVPVVGAAREPDLGQAGSGQADTEWAGSEEPQGESLHDGPPPARAGEPWVEGTMGAETVEPLGEEQEQALRSRLERLARRREQLGPVNPLAQDEYAEAVAHVEELEERRTDLETALRELRAVIRETDRQIHETFNETFSAAARNFEELVGDVFPGGSGRLRLVKDEQAPRAVLGGEPVPENGEAPDAEEAAEIEADADGLADAEEMLGVEIEITPAGKSTKRLSLLSGGEKSMTALAFMFSVFLARPCPFYVLDEVEAALDDLNLDRFLTLLRRYADRAQFIVITHQKRTMEAADWLYGVSMADNGVSKVLSRRLPKEEPTPQVAAVENPPQVAPVA